LKILNDFSNCTNLVASCHFDAIEFQAPSRERFDELKPSNANYFDEMRNNHQEHFCLYVQGKDGMPAKCSHDSLYYKNQAKQERRTITYTCHAGLCETVTPIILDNVVVGYIMLGKFIDQDNRYSTIEKVRQTAKKYDLDEEKLVALYEQVPVVSTQHLTSAINILQLCITQILEKHFIQVKNLALIEQIHTYILENLSEPLSVEEICNKFFVNRQKLHALFKKHFNDSAKHFILTQRLNKAKELLLHDDKSVEQIAYEVGFVNYNYFIRIFRSTVGVPPLQYKKQHDKHGSKK
jgi:YesN/AraC family two-component response regulator